MSTLQTLAAKLADDCIKAMEETGNDRFFVEVGNLLGASSQTLEEAFLTEIRVRLSATKAQAFIDETRAKARAAKAAPPPPDPAPAAPTPE